jgi:hypothetical protein
LAVYHLLCAVVECEIFDMWLDFCKESTPV